MADYGFYLTEAGELLVQQAITSGQRVDLAFFALGDGIWSTGESRETLKHQVIELPVSSVDDTTNPLMPLIKLVIPPTVGGFRVSEIVIRALLLDQSKVDFAISKYAGTYIPDPQNNPWVVDQEIYVDLNIGAPGLVEVRYNPLVTATIEYVNAKMQTYALKDLSNVDALPALVREQLKGADGASISVMSFDAGVLALGAG